MVTTVVPTAPVPWASLGPDERRLLSALLAQKPAQPAPPKKATRGSR
jgi:hypothetical protein